MVVSFLLEVLLLRSSWQHLEKGRELLLLRSISSVAAASAPSQLQQRSCCVAAAAGAGSGPATMSGRGSLFSKSVTRRRFVHHNILFERAGSWVSPTLTPTPDPFSFCYCNFTISNTLISIFIIIIITCLDELVRLVTHRILVDPSLQLEFELQLKSQL